MNSLSDFTLISHERSSEGALDKQPIIQENQDQSATIRWERLFYNSATRQRHDLQIVVTQWDKQKLESCDIQKIRKTFDAIFCAVHAKPEQSTLTPERVALITDVNDTSIQVDGKVQENAEKTVHATVMELYLSLGFIPPTITNMPMSDDSSSASPVDSSAKATLEPSSVVTPIPIKFTGFRTDKKLALYLNRMEGSEDKLTEFLDQNLLPILVKKEKTDEEKKQSASWEALILAWFKSLYSYWERHEGYIKHKGEPDVLDLDAFAMHWLPRLLQPKKRWNPSEAKELVQAYILQPINP